MKRTGIRTVIAVICTVIFAFSAAAAVTAASTDTAKEAIDTARECSLTLTYKHLDKCYPGLEIEVYRIASVSSDFVYTLIGEMASYPIEINKIQSQTEWDEIRSTVSMYISAGKVTPDDKQYTDGNGVVKFDELETGIYFVRWTGNETENSVMGFEPFLIAVPSLNDDGTWDYDIDALPKPGRDKPDYFTLFVTKQWRDGGTKSDRPVSILASIYRDGELYEQVTLSEENDWFYQWDVDGVYDWAVVEEYIGGDYTVTVSRDGATFTITNSKTPPPPPGGESSEKYLFMGLMAVSGIVLILLAATRKRSDAKE